ncbi:MAG TPA: hypothetical protein VMP11_17940 [Verrucomicrobiae bacterium]|nr:hypothetical protein [Verrucomicrobiae bacterium]
MNESAPVPSAPDTSAAPAAAFKDRSNGLIGFGVLVILIGCACAVLVPLMIVGQTMSATRNGASPEFRPILPAILMYAGLAVLFVSLGIGSTMARRWARALLLILSWAWLIVGVLTMLAMAIFLPAAFVRVPSSGGPAAMVVVMLFMLGFLSVFFLILPGILLLFYRSPHVKATCEARDPVPRWTDACPLPVLALSLLFVYGAVWMGVILLCYRGVMPFFGYLCSGLPGGALILLLIAVWLYCAWATYHLNPTGWWTAFAAIALLLISTVLTFSRVDLMEVYRQMGYSERQIELLQRYNYFTNQNMLVFIAISSMPFLVYLLFVKRYFRQRA